MKNRSIEYFALTDKGKVRHNNQDSVGCCFRQDGDFLAVVSDGIGGHNGGDIAARMVTSLILKYFVEGSSFDGELSIVNFLQACCLKINQAVYQKAQNESHLNGMGATMTALLISKYGTYWLNVGDSRLYQMSDELKQVTTDHTLVNELIRSNLITIDQASNHPEKHKITKAIGVWETIEVDTGKITENNDYYLLCSDGLYGMIDNQLIENIIGDPNSTVLHKAKKLLNVSLNAGGMDNISIILIKIIKDNRNEQYIR